MIKNLFYGGGEQLENTLLYAVPSEGDSCSVEDDEDDGEQDETELERLERRLFVRDRISGVVERALVSLVDSVEDSCGDGFRCSSEGMCEPIEGIYMYLKRYIIRPILRACMGSVISGAYERCFGWFMCSW